MRIVTGTFRGIGAALRARWGLAVVSAGLVLVLQPLLPAIILSVARKPWTYFTFNPWLKQLPEYLTGSTPLAQKLDFLTRVALFWFTADGNFGEPEWGFAVDAMDFVRFVVIAGLVGVYLALWRYERDLARVRGVLAGIGRRGGVLGALAAA